MITLKQASKKYNLPIHVIRDRLKVAGYKRLGRDWLLDNGMIKVCITEYNDGRRK